MYREELLPQDQWEFWSHWHGVVCLVLLKFWPQNVLAEHFTAATLEWEHLKTSAMFKTFI